MKKIYLSQKESSGIQVAYYPTTGVVSISGWYDSFVGIEGGSLYLKDFFEKLGITEKDCRKVFGTKKKKGKRT